MSKKKVRMWSWWNRWNILVQLNIRRLWTWPSLTLDKFTRLCFHRVLWDVKLTFSCIYSSIMRRRNSCIVFPSSLWGAKAIPLYSSHYPQAMIKAVQNIFVLLSIRWGPFLPSACLPEGVAYAAPTRGRSKLPPTRGQYWAWYCIQLHMQYALPGLQEMNMSELIEKSI